MDMRKTLPTLLSVLVLLMPQTAFAQSDLVEPILIQNEHQTNSHSGDVTTAIFGVREAGGWGPIAAKSQYAIPAYAIAQSLKSVADLKGMKILIGDNPDLYSGSQITTWVKQISAVDNINLGFSPLELNVPGNPKGIYDAVAILNLIKQGVIDLDNPIQSANIGDETKFYSVKPKYSSSIKSVFGRKIPLSAMSATNVPVNAQAMYQTVANTKEMGLIVPRTVRDRFDVHFLEFAVTVRRLPRDDIAELLFNVALPNNSLALELAPLRYGHEIDVDKSVRTPEIALNILGSGIEVGEIYQRKVRYTYIRPTVNAFGLRESKFAWSLSDEAVAQGSHKFIAVVGVPKGTRSIKAELSTVIRTTEKVVIAERTATTRQSVIQIDF